MDNPAILDMDYPTFSKVQTILENPSTMKSFLEVLPPDCTRYPYPLITFDKFFVCFLYLFLKDFSL